MNTNAEILGRTAVGIEAPSTGRKRAGDWHPRFLAELGFDWVGRLRKARKLVRTRSRLLWLLCDSALLPLPAASHPLRFHPPGTSFTVKTKDDPPAVALDGTSTIIVADEDHG